MSTNEQKALQKPFKAKTQCTSKLRTFEKCRQANIKDIQCMLQNSDIFLRKNWNSNPLKIISSKQANKILATAEDTIVCNSG
jgi:hypothetical protein